MVLEGIGMMDASEQLTRVNNRRVNNDTSDQMTRVNNDKA